MRELTKQTNHLVQWACGDLRELYIATDRRQNLDWRICTVYGKRPDEIRIADCVPVADFCGPNGSIVTNSFTSKTEALRVSEHLSRPLEAIRSQADSWGCWNWTDDEGRLVSQLCIPGEGDTLVRSASRSPLSSPITSGKELADTFSSGRVREIYEAVLQCAHEVHSELGCGHSEKTYENALASKLRILGFSVEQ